MAERPKGYGLTAETQQKIAGKCDMKLEAEAVAWIEAVVGERLNVAGPGADNLHEALKNGVMLCKLANKLQPGSVKKINESKMAFKMMENINFFLEFMSSYGVSRSDQFQTVDLYENQNMTQVVVTIHALGRKAQLKGYTGPVLGPKESLENKREFTDEQMRAGQNIVSLQMGSNKGASQAGMVGFGAKRHILQEDMH